MTPAGRALVPMPGRTCGGKRNGMDTPATGHLPCGLPANLSRGLRSAAEVFCGRRSYRGKSIPRNNRCDFTRYKEEV